MASRNRNTAGTAVGAGHPRADQARDHRRLERAEPAGSGRGHGDGRPGEIRRTDLGEIEVAAEGQRREVDGEDVTQGDRGGAAEQQRDLAGTPNHRRETTERAAEQGASFVAATRGWQGSRTAPPAHAATTATRRSRTRASAAARSSRRRIVRPIRRRRPSARCAPRRPAAALSPTLDAATGASTPDFCRYRTLRAMPPTPAGARLLANEAATWASNVGDRAQARRHRAAHRRARRRRRSTPRTTPRAGPSSSPRARISRKTPGRSASCGSRK